MSTSCSNRARSSVITIRGALVACCGRWRIRPSTSCCHLGPEPLEDGFDADYLYRLSRGRKAAVKTFIMDSRIVVGVGNIYANEALFLAGIRPGVPPAR